MLNSKPNNPGKYHQGNYIPKNKNKLVKLNTNGGVYYRSGLELKIMHWLDFNKKIVSWGAETIRVPYQLTHIEKGDIKIKQHSYYPDFYYKLQTSNDSIRQVIIEAKPQKEYEDVLLFDKGLFKVGENLSLKKLSNLEYRFKMAQKNSEKWKTMIKWCNKKGYEFIVITENHFNGKL